MVFYFDLSLAKPKGHDNPFLYYPKSYKQDPSRSIVSDDGKYDLTRFSSHEISIIDSVLLNVSKKYPAEYQAIGLANESYVVVYKPRYILFELIVIKYEKSNSPLDQIAVAFAFAMKGAQFRQAAISYFEKSINKVKFSVLDKFSSVNSAFVYMKFSELYEREWEYRNAIFWARKAMRRGGLNREYLQEKIKSLDERDKKLLSGQIKRGTTRKPSDKNIKFEREIHNAAIRFM